MRTWLGKYKAVANFCVLKCELINKNKSWHTWPEPLQLEQILGDVPFADPLPLQVPQLTLRLYLIVFLQPRAASMKDKLICASISASMSFMFWNPEKGFLPAPKFEKNELKMSALPNGPVPPKSESRNELIKSLQLLNLYCIEILMSYHNYRSWPFFQDRIMS